MEITKQDIDKQNAVVKISLKPEDYQEKVDKKLKEYSKNMNVPGFRPGKVPAGLVKKMHGKAVLADEINNILSDSLYKYLEENKIDILGNPLPKEEEQAVDFDYDREFEFTYDIGLAPDFAVDLSDYKVAYHKIKADKKMVDETVEDLRKRYGKMSKGEEVKETDMLYVEFTQLDNDGNILENGIVKKSTLSLNTIKNKDLKDKFIGSKQGDKIIASPKDLTSNTTDLAAMLGIEKDIAEDLQSEFQIIIMEIHRLEPADINQDLFDKVYGEGEVKSEEEFRDKIKGDLENRLEGDSDAIFYRDAMDTLLDKLKMPLPDQFLKRWLVAANRDKEEITPEKVEEEYDEYAKGLRKQLIENEVIKKYEIKVEENEVKDYARGLIRMQFAQYGQQLDDEDVENYLGNLLKNRDEVRRLYDRLYSDKILKTFKENIKIKEKEVSYDEFSKLAEGKNK